jgi:hypothetical protein
MQRQSAAAAREDDFDLPCQLTILRRAIACVGVFEDESSAQVCATDLARFCALAEVIVKSFSHSELARSDATLRRTASATVLALFYVRQQLDALPARRSSRSAVESIRRSLYAAVALLSERLGPFDGIGSIAAHSLTELDRALSMRLLVSDFHEAVCSVSRGRSNMNWTLLVAEAELAIAMQSSAFGLGPEQQRAQLSEIRTRIVRFKAGKGTLSKSTLHAEVLATSQLLASLSQRPDVKRHDERALAALSVTLSSRSLNMITAASAAETLAGLRGMDPQLDRLMLELPFEPAKVLTLLARRVSELRSRALAS